MKPNQSPQTPKNPPATSLTPRTYPFTKLTNLRDKRTQSDDELRERYKTTIPCFSGKKKLPKLFQTRVGFFWYSAAKPCL